MEITDLLLEMLTPCQLKELRLQHTTECGCKGVPPIKDGDVITCDHCDGTGRIMLVCRYYAIDSTTLHMERINLEGVGEIAYEPVD